MRLQQVSLLLPVVSSPAQRPRCLYPVDGGGGGSGGGPSEWEDQRKKGSIESSKPSKVVCVKYLLISDSQPDWKNKNHQTYSCQRDWCLLALRGTNGGPPWNRPHIIALVFLGPLIGPPLCRERSVFRTANVSFFSLTLHTFKKNEKVVPWKIKKLLSSRKR